MTAPKKFYAVARGRNPGIYGSWFGETGAEAQIKGFPGARFKGFAAIEEARQWLDAAVRETAGGPGREKLFFQQGNAAGPSDASHDRAKKRSSPPPLQKQADIPFHANPHDRPEKQKLTSTHRQLDEVVIYTDGACTGNPGPGGYGTVIINDGRRIELSGGYRLTTNNRMELTAIIQGLASLKKPFRVTLYSDSKYVVDAITKGWAQKWRNRNWVKYDGAPAKNPDLWARLLDLFEFHDVNLIWVKGHAGNRENERCDRLAVAAARRSDLPPDPGYDHPQG